MRCGHSPWHSPSVSLCTHARARTAGHLGGLGPCCHVLGRPIQQQCVVVQSSWVGVAVGTKGDTCHSPARLCSQPQSLPPKQGPLASKPGCCTPARASGWSPPLPLGNCTYCVLVATPPHISQVGSTLFATGQTIPMVAIHLLCASGQTSFPLLLGDCTYCVLLLRVPPPLSYLISNLHHQPDPHFPHKSDSPLSLTPPP